MTRECWEVRKIVTIEGHRCAPSPNPSYRWWINQRHTLVRWQKHSWEMQTEWTTRRSSLSHPFVPSFQPNNQPQLEFCRAGVSSQQLTSAMKPSKEESHVSRVLGLPVPATLCLRKLSLNLCFGHDFSGSQIKGFTFSTCFSSTCLCLVLSSKISHSNICSYAKHVWVSFWHN